MSVEPAVPQSALLEVPIFALVRLGGLARSLVHRALAEEGLSARSYFLLLCLHEHGALSQRELADRMFVDRSDLVKLLDELERSGQLERQPDSRDRRRHVVTLTPAGEAAFRRSRRLADRATASVLAGLDPDQQASLNDLVHQALTALVRADPGGRATGV